MKDTHTPRTGKSIEKGQKKVPDRRCGVFSNFTVKFYASVTVLIIETREFMDYMIRVGIFALAAILICTPLAADAATVPPGSAITYTITLQEDGTAIWHVEYPDTSHLGRGR